MNTLYHFGDSYSTSGKETLFSKYIGQYFDMESEEYGIPGFTNTRIFSSILKNHRKFIKGDIILVNWSFLNRFDTIVQNGNGFRIISSVNELFPYDNPHAQWIINSMELYELEVYNFFKTIQPFFEELHKDEIKSYHVFVDPIQKFKHIPLYPKLVFGDSYPSWLEERRWHNEESTHYTKGIQKELGNEYIKRMQEHRFNFNSII